MSQENKKEEEKLPVKLRHTIILQKLQEHKSKHHSMMQTVSKYVKI